MRALIDGKYVDYEMTEQEKADAERYADIVEEDSLESLLAQLNELKAKIESKVNEK